MTHGRQLALVPRYGSRRRQIGTVQHLLRQKAQRAYSLLHVRGRQIARGEEVKFATLERLRRRRRQVTGRWRAKRDTCRRYADSVRREWLQVRNSSVICWRNPVIAPIRQIRSGQRSTERMTAQRGPPFTREDRAGRRLRERTPEPHRCCSSAGRSVRGHRGRHAPDGRRNARNGTRFEERGA